MATSIYDPMHSLRIFLRNQGLHRHKTESGIIFSLSYEGWILVQVPDPKFSDSVEYMATNDYEILSDWLKDHGFELNVPLGGEPELTEIKQVRKVVMAS